MKNKTSSINIIPALGAYNSPVLNRKTVDSRNCLRPIFSNQFCCIKQVFISLFQRFKSFVPHKMYHKNTSVLKKHHLSKLFSFQRMIQIWPARCRATRLKEKDPRLPGQGPMQPPTPPPVRTHVLN